MQTAVGLRFLRAMAELGEDVPAYVQTDRAKRHAADVHENRRRSRDAAMHSRSTAR